MGKTSSSRIRALLLALSLVSAACGSIQSAATKDAGTEGGSSMPMTDAGASDAGNPGDSGNPSSEGGAAGGTIGHGTIGPLGVAPSPSATTLLVRPFLVVSGASACNATTCLSNGGIRP